MSTDELIAAILKMPPDLREEIEKIVDDAFTGIVEAQTPDQPLQEEHDRYEAILRALNHPSVTT